MTTVDPHTLIMTEVRRRTDLGATAIDLSLLCDEMAATHGYLRTATRGYVLELIGMGSLTAAGHDDGHVTHVQIDEETQK